MLENNPSNCEIVLTAAAFRRLEDREAAAENCPDDATRDKDRNILQRILPMVKILGRMRAADKVSVVRAFQKSGSTVGVCGDGWNDCAAMRVAEKFHKEKNMKKTPI